MKSVRAYAPATVANVACGFDIFGFALDYPGDEVIARSVPGRGVSLKAVHGDHGRLPSDPGKNTASVAVSAMLRHLKHDGGVELEVHKNMPLASGLGSSAASAAAALVATNSLLGEPLSRRELVPFAMEAERVACGTAHADNVAPSLLGGFVLIRSYDPLDVVSIAVPGSLWCAILHPDIEVRTDDARRVIKKSISIPQAVANWGNVAGLTAGLLTSDFALIGRSLHDGIFEPDRALLVPGFDSIKQAALESGALGSSLSGSGPSIFALCETKEKASHVAESMLAACKKAGMRGETIVSSINLQGAVVRES